ncbi:putative hydrolase or acyltransferase of alpha/beta superfamily [Caulobacter sp. AP07]|uniref:alpha/beta fold hydrolase n=1 Tax=Caulobacter sp. AP07 TaxID=1144304 RepID=UPI000271E414|nr:alpha/beta hydrolase [Caulobacter sp. AP07]EJL28288.1 putative hydrolase or acyltransferase of alpha/beta superfamily [Caulobacter sp. AP07]
MSFADLSWTSQDGLILHARDYAPIGEVSGVPVICIHGLTRNARDFEDLAPRIAATGRRVIAVDVRGRGRSARDPQPLNYHPGTYAMDIVALLDATGVDRAVFVGTSMGGIIAMVLASIRPEAIAGAVLNDVGPELAPAGLARIGGYVGGGFAFATWDEAAAYAKAINGAAFPTYADADWTVFARRLVDETPDGTLALAYDPDIAAPFKAADPEAPPADMYPLFRALAACGPVLLVRGAISDLIDRPIVERMRAAAPLMTYVEVPEVGHAPMLTEPAAWKALGAFLRGASLDVIAT